MQSKRGKQAYGLFEKVDGKWVRLYPSLFGSKEFMVRTCQNALLAYCFGEAKYPRELRAIGKLDEVQKAFWDRQVTQLSQAV